MDKILLFFMLSIVVCNGRPPRDQAENIKTTANRRSASVLRAIALYANPFGWIGTPNWPRRPTKTDRKTNEKTNVSYLWVIEIDRKYRIILFYFMPFPIFFFFFLKTRITGGLPSMRKDRKFPDRIKRQ